MVRDGPELTRGTAVPAPATLLEAEGRLSGGSSFAVSHMGRYGPSTVTSTLTCSGSRDAVKALAASSNV